MIGLSGCKCGIFKSMLFAHFAHSHSPIKSCDCLSQYFAGKNWSIVCRIVVCVPWQTTRFRNFLRFKERKKKSILNADGVWLCVPLAVSPQSAVSLVIFHVKCHNRIGQCCFNFDKTLASTVIISHSLACAHYPQFTINVISYANRATVHQSAIARVRGEPNIIIIIIIKLKSAGPQSHIVPIFIKKNI